MFGKPNGVQTILKFLTVSRKIKEPLAHLLLCHRAVTSPATTGLDLFVGKHGAARLTPIDGSKLTPSQSVLHEFGKEPLIPFVVSRIVALERSSPVVRESHPFDLLGDGRHVAFGDVVRMAAFRDGSVLCGHPEGIEAHGVEHIETHQALVSGHCIADGVVPDVPHVHLTGGVRVHLKAVEFRPVGVNVSVEQPCVVPLLLPANLVNRRRFH